jgi:uncharacterized membrane protein YcaP (DUF421 family)
MKEEEIHLWDWMRMLLGQTPWVFIIEIFIRLFLIYLILLVSMRLLGSRMSAQLSRTEMVAMVSLAAAIGIPLHSPDRGILPSIIVATVVVVLGRVIARASYLNQKFERRIQDDINILVRDGVISINEMVQTRLTVERVFAQLRSEGIKHLGEVKRLYIEANGSFTLIRSTEIKPGLTVIPEFDTDFIAGQSLAHNQVCKTCGGPSSAEDENNKCSNCKSNEWVRAVN